jgi:hypothetical protein
VGTLHEDIGTFVTLSPWIRFRMRNVLDKTVEKIEIHLLCLTSFYWKSCRLWDKVERLGRARQDAENNIICRVRFACWITKAAGTHSEYVILIAFPEQQWSHVSTSMLRYTYIVCLVGFCVIAKCVMVPYVNLKHAAAVVVAIICSCVWPFVINYLASINATGLFTLSW